MDETNLRDKDIGEKAKKCTYRERVAARAVLFKGEKIALLHVSKKGYYKLPGGGVEKGETIEEGLQRELMEETGCTALDPHPLGKVIEYRSQLSLKQISHCFSARARQQGEPHFVEDEIIDGFKLLWTSPTDAIRLISSSMPKGYEDKFIILRDAAIVKMALQHFRSIHPGR